MFLLLLPLLLWSCGGSTEESASPSNGFQCIMPQDVQLHSGDVVFRKGTGMASRVILKLDTAGIYSHSGIVVDSMGVKMIVHSVADEHDYEGDVDRVKMDTPEVYFSDFYAQIGEVCRFDDEAIAIKAAEIAMQAYKRRVLFDHDYDDSDTTKMYCSELVVYAYNRAGIDLVSPETRHEIDLPVLQTRCIFPSDLCHSKYLKSIYKF